AQKRGGVSPRHARNGSHVLGDREFRRFAIGSRRKSAPSFELGSSLDRYVFSESNRSVAIAISSPRRLLSREAVPASQRARDAAGYTTGIVGALCTVNPVIVAVDGG
ncbi:MAG: hypothetical protein ACLPKT_20865, partial [Methylocella sp.]